MLNYPLVNSITHWLKQMFETSTSPNSEVGTNNIVPKARCNKAQRSFQSENAQLKMRNLFF